MKRFKLTTSMLAIVAGTTGLTGHAAAVFAQPAFDEIVVTATKRDTLQRDVPIAMAVFTSEDVIRQNIVRPDDFISMTSNANIMTAVRPGESNVTIRGVQGNFGLTQPVAIVLDGVVAASPSALQQGLFDIEQIEVVKGPQGALYGRNSIAGAIIINTKKPRNDFEGKVIVGYGNGDSVKAQGILSGPIVEDKLYGRISVSHTETDGYWDNATTNKPADFNRERIVDARIIYEASDALTFDLRARASEIIMGSQLWTAQVAGYNDFDNNGYFPTFQMNNNQPGKQTRYDMALKIDYDLDFGTLTTIGSYNDMKTGYPGDEALNPIIFTDPAAFLNSSPQLLPGYSYAAVSNSFTGIDEDNQTLEVRLTSHSDQTFRWMVGGYYAHSDRQEDSNTKIDNGVNVLGAYAPETLDPFGINPISGASGAADDIDAYAGFARLEYDILPDLEATVSLRWDREDRSVRNTVPDIMAPASVAQGNPVPLTLFPGFTDSDSYEAWQPSASLRYRINDDVSVYASYGKGFRSGGFNPPGSTDQIRAAYDPNFAFQDAYGSEKSDSFEVGFKGLFLDNRLSFNGALFYTKIDDAQNFTAFPQPVITIVITQKKVRSQGVEFEASYLITENLRISNEFGYVDAEFTESDLPATVGNTVPMAPKYNNILSLDYTHDLTDDLLVNMNASWQRTGKMWFDIYNTPDTQRNAVDRVNVRVALESVDEDGQGWIVSAWAKNLFDEHYIEYAAPVPPIANFNYRGLPRTYGVDLTYKF